MTRPPSSRPVAPCLPAADHRLHALPSTVPLVTSVALLVSVAAGPLVAGDCGAQSEVSSGTTTAVVCAAAGWGLPLVRMPGTTEPTIRTAVVAPTARRCRSE